MRPLLLRLTSGRQALSPVPEVKIRSPSRSKVNTGVNIPFKEKGRAALPAELQSSFDDLWKTCSERGLFINPCGELESMLTYRGIPYTTDKRGWITKALLMLPGLEVNDKEYPWKFIKEIQEYLMSLED
ncbi:MAG: hypothetical protein ACYTXA_31360 [Nostoc sp.]